MPISALAVILSLGHAMPAQRMTNFAGAYQICNVAKDGDQVHLTVRFRLNNLYNTDIAGGIVVLLDSQPQHTLIGKVATIQKLARLGHITVSNNFTVTADEYDNWQRGHEPVFEFLVPNANGSIEAHIQARPAETLAQLLN
jgi:hypothetical protein